MTTASNYARHCSAAAGMALSVGCGSTPIPDPEPTYDPVTDGSGGGTTDGFDQRMRFGLLWRQRRTDSDLMDDDLTMVIYFDFDQSELRVRVW